MSAPMTAAEVVQKVQSILLRRASGRDAAEQLIEQYAQQRFAEVSEQLKRCRIHALNAESECADLRAELREVRRQLDEAAGRWAP